jgi:hypothetical protein
MSLSPKSEHQLRILRETLSNWAPEVADPERLFARERVDIVRGELAEPVTLRSLETLADNCAPAVAREELRVERRQRPDPAGEGSLGYYVLLQSQMMSDVQYSAKIELLWARRERALLAAQGIDSAQLALYRRLQKQFGHLDVAA